MERGGGVDGGGTYAEEDEGVVWEEIMRIFDGMDE